MKNFKMRNELKLSMLGWIVITGIYLGLAFWFVLPLQPLASTGAYAQVILKGIVFLITVACQISMMINNDLDNEVSITYFILLVLLQISAIIGLMLSTEFLKVSSENNLIGFLYFLVLGSFLIIYGLIIVMTVFWAIIAGFNEINRFIRYRAKYILPYLPIVKLLFKQPKKEKPIEKVKM